MKVVTAEQMREIDRVSIHERGINGYALMTEAGRAIARSISDIVDEGNVLVLCGRGNNGGDGCVAARILAENGYRVTVLPVLGTEKLSEDARKAYDDLPKEKIRVQKLTTPESFAMLLGDMDAVLDAMLGTGATPPLRDPMTWIADVLNKSRIPVIAADIPTGLHADTGEGDNAVRATRTITIGLPKRGMLTPNGYRVCGSVAVESIQFPRDLLESSKIFHSTSLPAEVAALLPKRPVDSHKATFGTVVVCAGSAGMPGAAVICGTAAMRAGAGLVRMHVPSSVRPIVAAHLPEAIFSQVEDLSPQVLSAVSQTDWESISQKAKAFVIGPGMTTEDGPRNFLEQVLMNFDGPVLIDADGLTLLAKDEKLRKLIHPQCVLTPHPGEMGRLLDKPVEEVEADRWASAEEAARQYNCIILYKGFGTLVATPGGEVTHVPADNTALARGATGDTLAGLTGGLLAQGMEPDKAAILATFVGGLAADVLTRKKSARGVIVREILDAVPLAWRELEEIAQQLTGSG